MPTGYTSKLHDGEDQTFPEFVMACARAFGALIEMRDAPPDAEIPDQFKPSTYHLESLNRGHERLATIEAWSDVDADDEAEASYRKALTFWEESEVERRDTQERYEAMLAQVDAWQPPTAEHEELKKFMHDQLAESIRFDCDYRSPRPERLSGADFKTRALAEAKRSIEYDEKYLAEDVKRAQGRTEWVRALRRSLPGAEGT